MTINNGIPIPPATLSAISVSLTVAGDTGDTPIGNAAPTDRLYSASQLAITVTALPTDGTVMLSNGTLVKVGETLTVAQLTGLEFAPTSGLFNQSSTFTYLVKDPAGETATGSDTLKIAADTSPPKASSATLTVAGNSAATPTNIVAPTDAHFTSSQLSVTVTALPTDGRVLLSNGTTAVTVGETLTVAQLTGLEFQPTAGVFGQSSTFTYLVTDPAGLTASGSETLKIAADTSPPVANNGTLTVAGNATATAINISSPSDPNYSASQLTVTVTALPTDGSVLLSNGTTAVTVGEALTVAQLTGLEFQPTAGEFGQSSNFTYSVKDPAGLTASGSETLKIAADASPPIATNATLNVAGNAKATAINIPLPSDANYAASQLTVTVTALPTDGSVLLSNGTTAVTVGEALTVAQLTGLEFQPTTGVFGQSSNFTYSVKDPAGLTATGSETLTIGAGTGLSPIGASLMAGSGGSLVTSEGTWTFSTTTAAGGEVVLLNGQPPSAGGSATELLIGSQGQLYAENTGGNWYEWLNSNWSPTVNPNGASASPPRVTDATLAVAENSEATTIAIPTPSDANYAASQLTVTVTALPTDGSVLLSNGTTAVTVGEALTVAQLTGLEFQPTTGVFGQSSNFTYSVKDPAGLTATGSETLTIGAGTGLSPIGASLMAGSGGSLVTSEGTWTFSTTTAAGGEVVLLNGQPPSAGGSATELLIGSQGQLYAENTGGNWYEWLNSNWSPTVNPNGASASPPRVTDATLAVAENSEATTIAIPTPSDANYAASQLTVTVTALPTDGEVLLSNGTTAVTVGEALTVAQLTGLEFQPTTGVFGQSSNFTYSVKDPAGLTATGSETLTIAADTTPPTTTDPILTVAENSAATAINIPSPSDPNYTASQLTVTVTALPTDGEVLLSNGTTAVTVGEALTVAQLTGLEFQPTTGVFGQSSNFTYSVKDPAGLTATGSETLTIAADTTPPTTTDPILTVAENSAATAINIPSPSDPNYTASQLTVTVTALPTDGEVLLSNGTTAVTVGEALTVAQLTGLEFQPTTGVFGQSSNFTYSVKDPAGLTASGSETLAIGNGTGLSPDGSILTTGSAGSLITSDGTWTFSTATAAGGEVVLLNGEPPGAGGSAMELVIGNQGQLYAENTGGNWYQWSNSNWLPTSNPAGATASPPEVNADVTLAVAENSAATAIGIPAPSDANYAASQLTVTVAALPTDGMVLLSNGTTAVTVGEALTVAQLTGLEFQPTAGTSGQTSTFSYVVADPAGLTATGTDTLTINGGAGAGADVASGTTNSPSLTVIDSTPVIIQPSQPGDIVGVQLQNTGSTAESSGYVTFGEVFKDGAVTPGESLVARINGVNYAVQMDVKTTNTDGSVSDAVLTLDAPTIAANSSISAMLAQGTASAPSVTAPSPQSLLTSLLAGSDNTTVNFTFNNADGSTTTDSTSAAQALQQALANGTVQTWLSGPEVNQYDVTTTVDNGNLKVEFDIQAYANGTTSTNVIFDNSWMNSPGKTDLNYNVSIGQGGQTVYSANNVEQYLYSLWNYQANSAGTISPNVQYNISYLESTGAIQAYDTSVGVAASTIASYAASLNATNTGPLGTADVTTYMPTTGGRDDIGPQPAWVSEWLLSQSATAEQTMMANADAAGGIPWHFTDESTGEPINPITYSNFWDDPRGSEYGDIQPANGLPTYAAGGGQVSSDGDPWQPDPAHMPDLNYIPYLVTGSPYQLELLQAQADYAISSTNPAYAQNLIPGSNIEYGIINTGNQTRAIAWDIRAVAEAAYATPNSDPLKAAYTTELQSTMASMVQQYITGGADSANGQIQGFIQGANSPSVSPWQQGYIVTSLAEVAGMNIPQASADAVEMLQYMNNFVSGLYTNAAAGFNPIEGPAYWLNTTDPTTGAPYTTWAQLYDGNLASGNIPTPTNVFPNFPTDTQGGYGEIAMAALADEITYTGSPQAIQAYGYVVSQIAYAFAQGGGGEAAAFASNPEWDIMPKLSDGTYLTASQMQIDTSSNNVNLTATGGDSLLSVVGGGTDTLTGGTDAVDLLYGGTGNDTLVAGSGNDYLFGGTGTNTFIDGPGNNYMSSNGTANTYVFNLAKSGSDTIANFNVNTDQLVIASNLNGDGITSVAALIAGATVTNGNTVLHLGTHDQITLIGVTAPSALIHDIVIS